ncbi:hypothetical protein VNO78_08485 [Psophocarpus tetragonolobus]|uniref:Uncharacterized protein n=1 Tax=Psophocarpus tetragonolobus TaxID=3891 RepID=A0AAN9XTT0_PSOTE
MRLFLRSPMVQSGWGNLLVAGKEEGEGLSKWKWGWELKLRAVRRDGGGGEALQYRDTVCEELAEGIMQLFGGSMLKGRARKSCKITPPKFWWFVVVSSFKVPRFMSFHTSSIRIQNSEFRMRK